MSSGPNFESERTGPVERKDPTIVAWMKPSCGWSNGVRAVFGKYGLEYADKDIINYPENFYEMVMASGQQYQPCVEINGVMLADVSGEEVEAYLIQKNVVGHSARATDVPLDAPCETHDEPVEIAQPMGIQLGGLEDDS
jgi:monothiol glutaredoxin